jgi:hypothetical protein
MDRDRGAVVCQTVVDHPTAAVGPRHDAHVIAGVAMATLGATLLVGAAILFAYSSTAAPYEDGFFFCGRSDSRSAWRRFSRT